MQPVKRTLVILLVGALAAVPILSQGTIRDGDVTLGYLDFGGAGAPTTRLAVPIGSPQTTQSWWWYRLPGDDRESRLPDPDTEHYSGNVAILDWADVGGRGFSARLVSTVVETSTEAGAAASWIQELRIAQGAAAGDLEIFHYADVDLNGDFDDSGAMLGDPGHIRLTDLGDEVPSAELLALDADAFEVGPWPSLVTALEDTDIDLLENGGLPFSPPGDLTTAFSWSSGNLTAGQSKTFRVVLAIGSDAHVPQLDLSITKTDGQESAVPGEPVTYSLVIDNAGPATAFDALVSDAPPTSLLDVSWTCVPAGGAVCSEAGVGDIDDVVFIPRHGRLTYTLSGIIDPGARGVLENFAVVSVPEGLLDPDPDNNGATDIDTLTPVADLIITKDDQMTSVIPGQSEVTYTITASNTGPSSAPGALVEDFVPSILETVTWTCNGAAGGICATPGVGDLLEPVDLPVGASVTYRVTGSVVAGVVGTLVNTASIRAPADVHDPILANNSATDVDMLVPTADLEVELSDGTSESVPGLDASYTIKVTNKGPADVAGAWIRDVFPPDLDEVSWTCNPLQGAACPVSGTGDLATTIDLPAASEVTFFVIGTVSPAATGNLVNSASITVPDGTLETDPGDNSATDINAFTPRADLAMGLLADRDAAYAGDDVNFEISVVNLGPSDADGARVQDFLPSELQDSVWVCEATAGATCTTEGSGNIDETVSLAAGASMIYLVAATIEPSALGPIRNLATVTSPPSVWEINPENNSMSAVLSLWLFADDFESGDLDRWSASDP